MRSPVSAGKEGGAKAFPDPKPNFSNHPSFRQPAFARQMPQQQQQPIPPQDFKLDMDNAQMLRDHVRSQFSKPALTDCHLQLSHDSDASTQKIDAHKIILARSPTLLRLIQNASETQRPQLDVHLPGRHLSLHTFNECLKYIYGVETGPAPVVFVHGLGLGLVQYQMILSRLLHELRDRPLLVPLQPHVSQQIFHRDFLAPKGRQETAAALRALLVELGWAPAGGRGAKAREGRITLMSHSNGSFVHAWLLKAHPELFRRSCFVDPVTFCSWEGGARARPLSPPVPR